MSLARCLGAFEVCSVVEVPNSDEEKYKKQQRDRREETARDLYHTVVRGPRRYKQAWIVES